jgi:hypothetical protein
MKPLVRLLVCAAAIAVAAAPLGATHVSFERGDLFISLEGGPVQWRLPDGSLLRILLGTVPGTGEGMGFDSSGNLYVARWCMDPQCGTANTVERFDVLGRSWGPVGSGYDCNPHAVVFDAHDVAYVGQAGCSGSILKFVPGELQPQTLAVAPERQGSFWVDLAPDGCTLFYTSYGPNVKRFDGCAGVQLADFNAEPLPGVETHDVRALPDGGAIVSNVGQIVRLDANGLITRTYTAPEASYWSGLDLAGDGTFWAANYESSNVHRFDLDTGAILTTINAVTPMHQIVGIRVMR